ncbi:NAD-dependent DNA ligase [uncultured virus]|nr:NAD-dependent DNA ligase [uncultured virus]
MSYYQLNEDSPAIKNPKGLKIRLRPHQLTSVYAMRELEKTGNIIVDCPEPNSGLINTIRYMQMEDAAEFCRSTFVIETNSAILADKVGAGKTYMAIGLILNTPVPKPRDRFILGSSHFAIKMISEQVTEQVNLIVVPHNLANQWSEFMDNSDLPYLKLNSTGDFDAFFDVDYVSQIGMGNKNVLTTHVASRRVNIPLDKLDRDVRKIGGSKTKATPKVVPKKVWERRVLSAKKVRTVLDTNRVIVLNINRYKFFKQIFPNTKWARVFVDEMDSANIPPTFSEFGNFHWFLTATPTAIFQRSCRRYVNRIFGHYNHLLPYFTVRNTDAFVDKSVVLPKPHVFMIDTLLNRVVNAIRDMIPDDVLRMINAGNMREAVARLNCDMDTEENIIKVLTDKIVKDLHNMRAELDYLGTIIPADKVAHEKRVEKLEQDINRCQIKLDTVRERMSSVKEECCFICTEVFENPTILECCKNVFCFKCLLNALRVGDNKCPYCREVIKNNKGYHVIAATPGKKKGTPDKTAITSGLKPFNEMDKADVLQSILTYIAKEDPNPRILIFSDFPQTFEKIIKNIKDAGLNHSLISGIPAHITNVINSFESGRIQVLMLDSKHYGSGLNLQMANYLILYHRMRPELETQVIGRAQRFGRKIPLRVIYLVNQSESHTTKLATNPHCVRAADELWTITDSPVANGEAYIVEDDDLEEAIAIPKVIDRSESEDDTEDARDDPDIIITNAKPVGRPTLFKKAKVVKKANEVGKSALVKAKPAKAVPKKGPTGGRFITELSESSEGDPAPTKKKTVRKIILDDSSDSDVDDDPFASSSESSSDSESEEIIKPTKTKAAKKAPKAKPAKKVKVSKTRAPTKTKTTKRKRVDA